MLLACSPGVTAEVIYLVRDGKPIEKNSSKRKCIAAVWYLIRSRIVPGSGDKTWQEQRDMLAEEEVPRACQLVYATLLYFLVRRIRLFNRGEFARCTDTIPRYGNLVNAGVMTGTFERDGLRLGGLWWNYRLHYVGVASMQELIQG